MKRIILITVVLLGASSIVACQSPAALASQDKTPPSIQHIETSTKFLALSDCKDTSEAVTADITDESGIKQATIWFRVGANQKYTPVNMSVIDNKYSVTVKALDTPGRQYGVWEFYITAEDQAGNKSQSPLDTSVQLLPCVGS